ncbi:MAG: hypothetical protein NTY77_19255 [Elusimicrobia bacterium]|nr:hypothetical protein [Elusimicrobiota bacterium]
MTEQEPHVRIVLPRIPSWFFELPRLELRKQRLAFVGLAAAFIVTLPLAWLGAVIGHADRRAAIDALFLFWTTVGLPGAAALLGASAGVGLRAEPAAAAESVLPASPARRAAMALAAAALQLAALAAVVLLMAAAVSPGWRTTFTELVWSAPEFQRAVFRLLAFNLGYILAASFVCAYGLGHGLAGGLLGLGLAGIGSTALAAASGMQALYDERELLRPGGLFMIEALCLSGAAYALGRCASRLERRAGLGWLDFTLCGLAVSFGSVLCVLAMVRAFGCLVHHPQPIRHEDYFARAHSLALRLVPGLREADAQGLLVGDMDGRLMLLKPDGRRTVLAPGERVTLGDIFDVPLLDRNQSAEWDADGTLWSLHSKPLLNSWRRTLMHGRPGERFKQLPLAGDGGWQLVHRGLQVGTLGWSGDGKQRFTPLSAQGLAASRSVAGELPKMFSEGWAELGLAAAAGKDGKSISWRGRTWRLPGKIVDGIMFELSLFPAVTAKPAPVFALNAFDQKGASTMVLCRPGAKAQTPWPGKRFYAAGLSADGTLWSNFTNRTLLMIRPDGSAAPLLDLAPALAALPRQKGKPSQGLSRFPILLRVGDGELWALLSGRWLARLDAKSGALKACWELPCRPKNGRDSVQSVPAGFFLHDGERTFFVDWEGKARKLM